MKLIALLHGYGASGADLHSLSRPWGGAGRQFISPDAPDRCAGMGPGLEWFTLNGWMPGTPFDPFTSRIDAAAKALRVELDAELAARGLGWKDLVLMGFSQGAIMALAVGLNAEEDCAGIMAYSGAYIVPVPPRAKPPVLLVHGDMDVVVSPDAYHDAREKFTTFGIEHEAHLLRGCGHWIDPAGLDAGRNFLSCLP